MIKKKYFLLLSTLLLTVLLGFCTSSFAFVPTENELKNFICNYALFYNVNYDINGLKTYLDNHSTDLQSWLTYLERYEGKYILSGANGRVYMWVYTGSESNLRIYGPYRTEKRVGVNSSYLSKFRWNFNLIQNNYEFSNWDTEYTLIANDYNQFFYYTDTTIYTDGIVANGNVWASIGTSNPNRDLFSGYYYDSSFDIDINADYRNNKATISNDTSGTEYFLIPYTSGKIRIGNMFDYSNLAGVVKRKFRYKQSTRSFDLIQEYQADTTNLEFFDIAEDTLIVFEYYQPETTEFITFIPKEESGFSEFTVPIYFTTDNTRIINGVIDTGDMFSGDYYHNYNNDTNTDKVIDNVNDGSEVDTILNNFTSGDLLNAGGYVERDNPFRTFILAFVYDVCNILLNPNQEDVYFDYSMHGEPPTRLYASQFTTPETPLKAFIRLSMIFGSLFIVYIQFKEVIDLISTGNAAKVLHLGDADVYFYKM